MLVKALHPPSISMAFTLESGYNGMVNWAFGICGVMIPKNRLITVIDKVFSLRSMYAVQSNS
jgi:hypothetical protein